MITPSFSLTATERVLPKLALDFTTANLDPRVTFTRTTNATNPATYVNSSGYLVSATNNQPRFDYDPSTLLIKGLLIEESRTNYCLYSNDLSPTPTWVKSNGSFVANDAISPDGTQNANKLTVTGASPAIYTTITINSTSVAFSFYAKKGSSATACNQFNIRNGTTATNLLRFSINYDTGVITYVTGSSGVTATNFGNGWWRISMVVTSGITSGNSCLFYAMLGSWAISDYCYFYGAQVEYGAFSTSYIPTTGTALTRNADVATMTGTNFSDWFNASEGAAVVQVLPSTISGTRPAIEFDDNTANQAITLRGVAADPQLFVVNGGAAQATLDAGTITANAVYKLGGAWKSSSFAASVNGGGSVSQLSGTYPTVTQARLGSDGTNYLNGCLQNLRYWPQRITNAETQAFSK